MKLVKKTFILVLCLGLVSIQGFAGVGNVSRTQSSQDVHDSSVFPAKSSATVSAEAMNPFDNGGIVYGLHLSSNAAGRFVVLRDSDTANTTSSTMTVVGFTSAVDPVRVTFDPPLRIQNGLSINASSCAGVNAGWCYTVLYDSNP